MPFVLTSLFKMTDIHPAARKTEAPAFIHLFAPKLSQRKWHCSLWLPWQTGYGSQLQKATIGVCVHNRMKLVWSSVVLWLFVNEMKGTKCRKWGNVCYRHSSGCWTSFLQDEYCFHTVLRIFHSCVFLSLWTHFLYMQDHENIPSRSKILDMNQWACVRWF